MEGESGPSETGMNPDGGWSEVPSNSGTGEKWAWDVTEKAAEKTSVQMKVS